MENIDFDEMMSEIEIYAGTYSSNTLPKKLKKGFVYVVNNMPSHSPGEHWLALWSDETPHAVEVFDSFGFEPTSKYPFLRKRIAGLKKFTYVWSTRQIQNDDLSSTCGQYICGYILFKNCGGSLKDYINIFGNDLAVNDATIHRFINEAYDRNFKLHDLDLVKNLLTRHA